MFDDKAISNADGNSALCTIYAPDPTSDSCRLSSRSMRPAIYLFIMTEITKALFMVHSIIAADRADGGYRNRYRVLCSILSSCSFRNFWWEAWR
jgi:hypothetical protein